VRASFAVAIITVLAILAAGLAAADSARARSLGQFTPLPGPDVLWTIPDPSFDALPGARALAGTYAGAAYRIEVPGNWNGELVVYAHGFRGNPWPVELRVTDPPIREHLIANGYAWAASSYRTNGYVPGIAAQDSLLLKGLFQKLVGSPQRTYLYGTSMGGHAAMISAEFYPRAYDAILSECGNVAGPELFDFYIGAAAAAEFISGVNFASLQPSGPTLPEVGLAVLVKTAPILGSVDQPTEKGSQLLSVIANLSGGPRPFFREGEARDLATQLAVGSIPLIYGDSPDLSTAPLLKATGNQATQYTIAPGLGLSDSALNAGVRRLTPDPSFRNRFGPYAELAPLTGEIEVPVIQIKGTGDLFVPISMERRYLALAKAAGTSNLLVQRAIRAPGHCNFSQAERTRAFDDLVRWLKTGIRPAGDDLSGDLRDIGRQFTDPIRPDDPGTTSRTRPLVLLPAAA